MIGGNKLVNKHIAIAIDGPAAAGKSTVAKEIAKQLSLVYIDTGAMYRAFTYKALKCRIDLSNETALFNLLKETSIRFTYNDEDEQLILLDDVDVTEIIRTDEVSNNVSIVAQHPLVRKEMVVRQQQLAKNDSVIMDGRDIGTYVLPNADKKFFLQASVKERAKRRYEENKRKGYQVDFEQLMKEIRERDERDMNRAVSPLKRADDAILIDTTSLTIEEVIQKIMKEIRPM